MNIIEFVNIDNMKERIDVDDILNVRWAFQLYRKMLIAMGVELEDAS
jgi:hypothetical protein